MFAFSLAKTDAKLICSLQTYQFHVVMQLWVKVKVNFDMW